MISLNSTERNNFQEDQIKIEIQKRESKVKNYTELQDVNLEKTTKFAQEKIELLDNINNNRELQLNIADETIPIKHKILKGLENKADLERVKQLEGCEEYLTNQELFLLSELNILTDILDQADELDLYYTTKILKHERKLLPLREQINEWQ